MIDTKELRRLAQAALIGPDGVSLNWLKLLQDFQKEANPAAVSELLDRLEAAEKSDAESIRMYRKSRDERDKLRNALQALVEHFEYYIGDNECRPLENARATLEESK